MEILLIEDDKSISAFINKGLKEYGFNVHCEYDGLSGLQTARSKSFNLIVLDRIMPKMDGIEVCQKLRANGLNNTPILMLTALNNTKDIVDGLNNGADDYITKPFKFQEFLARITALIRRYDANEESVNILEYADLKLDMDRKEVFRNGEHIELTAKEFKLLEYLMKNQGRVLSRVDILDKVWDINFDNGTNVVDVYMNYLRNKVDKPFKIKLIQTITGMGYSLRLKS